MKEKVVVLLGALSLNGFAIENNTLPTYIIDKAEKEELEEESNSLGGVKNISDWFKLMPSVLDFDVDDNGSIDATEHYAYTKNVRWLFFNSSFVMDADADSNGYADSQEWSKQVAKVRVSGDWVKVFDTDQSGEMSVDEELLAVKHMADIYSYYGSIAQHTSLAWGNTVDPDDIKTKYAGNDWKMNAEEIGQYLTDNKASFIFYYDWNADGDITGIEAITAGDVVNRTFNKINEYLQQLKAQKYSDYL